MSEQNVPQGDSTGQSGPRREAAALALAAGKSREGAAADAGVSARTIKRWAQQAAFAARVDALRSQMTGQALGVLTAGQVAAGETLRALVEGGKSEMVRLHASRSILELSVKLREATELEQRVQVLEKALADQQARAAFATPGSNGRAMPCPH